MYNGATNQYSTVGGGFFNTAGGNSATVGGGYINLATNDYSTVGGGAYNTASGDSSIVGGGWNNTASGSWATVGGGRGNAASAFYATVGGGYTNTASGWFATVSGGSVNTAGGYMSTVGGGEDNTASGFYATVPGGYGNYAFSYAFAAGRRAKANHEGAFVWADSTDADFSSTRSNQFNLRARGGVRIDTGSGPGIALNAADTPLITRGWDPFGSTASAAKQGHGRWGLFMEPARLVAGIPGDDVPNRYFHVAKYDTNGTYVSLLEVRQNGHAYAVQFNNTSSREVKEDFRAVDGVAVLERLKGLPITRWRYKGGVGEHLGPVAEDFRAVFGLGEHDKHIATGDLGGVALAAIQGLNQKVESANKEATARIEAAAARIRKLESENAALREGIGAARAENAALRARLEKLERLLETQLNGGAQ